MILLNRSRIIIACFLLTSILSSCLDTLGNNQPKTIPLSQNIRMAQYDKLDGITDFKVSFIPIKTTELLLPDHMRFAGISENYLYLYNKDVIISIDMSSGDIIRQIDRKGNGPEEYISILSASVDNKDKLIVIYDPGKDRISKYDYYGNFICTLELEEKGAVGVLPDGNYIVCYRPYSSKQHLYGIYDKYGKLIRESNGGRLDTETRILTFNMSQNFNNSCFIRQAYQDTIVCIDTSNEFPMLYMDLGKYRMPDKYRQNLKLMEDNIDRYIDISDLNIVNDYLFLSYFYNNKLYRDVWNITKPELLSRSIIKDQESRFGFPLQIKGNVLYCWCDFTNGNSLFCILPYWESVKVFPDLKEEDNPIIIKIDL